MVGAGGGFLIIPALVFLTGLPFKTAVGTSLFIISINSLFGFAGDLLNYSMDWPLLLSLTALAVIGILIGNKLSKKIAGVKLKITFGWIGHELFYFVCAHDAASEFYIIKILRHFSDGP